VLRVVAAHQLEHVAPVGGGRHDRVGGYLDEIGHVTAFDLRQLRPQIHAGPLAHLALLMHDLGPDYHAILVAMDGQRHRLGPAHRATDVGGARGCRCIGHLALKDEAVSCRLEIADRLRLLRVPLPQEQTTEPNAVDGYHDLHLSEDIDSVLAWGVSVATHHLPLVAVRQAIPLIRRSHFWHSLPCRVLPPEKHSGRFSCDFPSVGPRQVGTAFAPFPYTEHPGAKPR